MSNHDTAIVHHPKALSRSPALRGLLWGGLGVVAFSLSFPMTRLAVGGIDPIVVGLGRAVVAGVLAAAMLGWQRAPLPPRRFWPGFAMVVAGVVIGFPAFSSVALRLVPSAHGAVITGLLPIATAIMAVLRAGERPSGRFWLAAVCGLLAVLVFAAVQGAGRPQPADAMILAAVALAALGYAEGGRLARTLGGAAVISWALVFSLPLLVPVVAWRLAATGWPSAGPGAWAGFAYVSAVSMFLGFFAWYRGLALGGVAKVGQLQLAQPVLTLLWSALLLGEHLGPAKILAALAILACVVLTQTARPRSP
jgi:drug/metabolite transporter (DMT)-like permease